MAEVTMIHALVVRFRRRFHASRLIQIGLIVALWVVGEGIVRWTGFPAPGGVVGMLLALGLLATHRVSLFSMKRGAEWFLGEMLLFFIPAVLAVTDHHEFFGLLGLKVLAVIVASTIAVMGVTAVTIDLCYRWRSGDDGANPLPA
jgi:holin-like protein